MALAVLSGPAAADDVPLFISPGGWQGAAEATAEAAAEKSAVAAPVAPAPKPAARPPAPSGKAPDAAKAAEVTKTAPPAKAAEPAKPAASAKKSDAPKAPAAKTTDTKTTDTKAPDTKATDAKADAKPKDAKAAEPAAAKDAKDEKPKKPALAAKQLFGSVTTAAPLAARAVGWYAKGCLAGGKALAVDGPGWQVMRLSRNRNWGHPKLVAMLERLARETTANKEWPGLLVGDMSQPRGGPMISGHASHQVGLDADIWLTPMPDRTLTKREREDMSAVSMLANAGQVDTKVFGEGQIKLIKRAASYPEVERILVHPAIKKALCEAPGSDKHWLSKVRPYFSHYYHFHVRIGCPAGAAGCTAQPPVPGGDGCDTELKDWLKRVAPKPKPPPVAAKPPGPPAKPAPPKPQITLADLPADCRTVLTAGGNKPPTEPATLLDKSKDAGPERDLTVNTAAPPEPPAAKPTADANAKSKPAKATTQ